MSVNLQSRWRPRATLLATGLICGSLGFGAGAAVGVIAGIFIGEGSAQRAHQEHLERFLREVIARDPEYANLSIEFGSGTQVYLVGSVPSQEAYDRLAADMQHSFGEAEGANFMYQVEVASPASDD